MDEKKKISSYKWMDTLYNFDHHHNVQQKEDKINHNKKNEKIIPIVNLKTLEETIINIEISFGSDKLLDALFIYTDKQNIYKCEPNQFFHLGKGLTFKKEIIKIVIKSGESNIIIMTTKGSVYTCGHNSYGECGLNCDDKMIWMLTKVEGIDRIVKIVSAVSHVLALSEKGDLYSWGLNYNGQCGTGDSKNVFKPTKIMEKNIINMICSGPRSNLALTNEGLVYEWGVKHYMDNKDPKMCSLCRPSLFQELIDVMQTNEHIVELDFDRGFCFAASNQRSVFVWRSDQILDQRIFVKYPLHLTLLRSMGLRFIWLLNFNLNLNEKDDNGFTPLSIACECSSIKIIQKLLDKNVDVSIEDHEGFLPLQRLLTRSNVSFCIINRILQINPSQAHSQIHSQSLLHLLLFSLK